jgi:serine/threonine protein kinase
MISTGPSFFRGIQNEMNSADLHSNSIRGTYVKQTCFTTLACHESHIVSVAYGIQWRAPEEYSYKPETEKIDVWSLGNVLYYLLTRREPFDKYSDDEIPAHVMEGNVPDIEDATILNSTHLFDTTLLKVVKMCWEYDPKKRPSSRQVASILHEALNKLN